MEQLLRFSLSLSLLLHPLSLSLLSTPPFVYLPPIFLSCHSLSHSFFLSYDFLSLHLLFPSLYSLSLPLLIPTTPSPSLFPVVLALPHIEKILFCWCSRLEYYYVCSEFSFNLFSIAPLRFPISLHPASSCCRTLLTC
uniref:Uncharacterized protein n=1 Tax=Cacopsylla melanoneura TaxID=428564 RepID=A0A8D8TAD2_9HEMI